MKKIIDKFVCDYDLICSNNAKFCVDVSKCDCATKYGIKYIFLCNSHLNILIKKIRVDGENLFFINQKYNNYKYAKASISFHHSDDIVYHTIKEFKKILLLE